MVDFKKQDGNCIYYGRNVSKHIIIFFVVVSYSIYAINFKSLLQSSLFINLFFSLNLLFISLRPIYPLFDEKSVIIAIQYIATGVDSTFITWIFYLPRLIHISWHKCPIYYSRFVFCFFAHYFSATILISCYNNVVLRGFATLTVLLEQKNPKRLLRIFPAFLGLFALRVSSKDLARSGASDPRY